VRNEAPLAGVDDFADEGGSTVILKTMHPDGDTVTDKSRK
jgi:hypothetical protein